MADTDTSSLGERIVVEREFAGRPLSIETGLVAKQASGAVIVKYGETTVLCTAQHDKPRPFIDFFPLSVDYRERMAAAGKFPAGFFKREGRPTQKETLTARLTDRPIRPLWPKGYKDEIQIMINVLACDGVEEPDVLGITGASAALHIADLPFQGPIAAVRVGLIGDDFIAMPTHEQIAESELDLVVAGSKESILMIEGFAHQLPEEDMVDALMFGHEFIQELCELQEELLEKVGTEKTPYDGPAENPWLDEIRGEVTPRLREVKQNPSKKGRSAASREIRNEVIEKHFPEGSEDELSDGRTKSQLKDALYAIDKEVSRRLTLEGNRLDGRKTDDLRAVKAEVDLIPRVHGSALFTRGETQSLATVTLGTLRDQQRMDSLFEESSKSFMLDYNFPPYSVGEARPIRGPGRREIGHGALAERSVAPVLPKYEKFPYTIRVISDITESNGSSSMASVCSATLAMMAAGVPLRQPVAGISIGLVREGDEYVLLTDIIGDEDHFGDMDFKIAGSGKGITGIQLDLKIDGINEEIIKATLEQAKDARHSLLRSMLEEIEAPRKRVHPSAPRVEITKIDPEKIGLLIGPGGKTIKALQEETGTKIDIEDDGTVMISAPSTEACEDCLSRIEAMTEEIRVGRVYSGVVNSIKEFGCFVEIAPGKDGLVHVSELANEFVKNVSDVVKVGDRIDVKVIKVDEQNRVKLSRKALLDDDGGDSDDDDGYDD